MENPPRWGIMTKHDFDCMVNTSYKLEVGVKGTGKLVPYDLAIGDLNYRSDPY